MDYKFQLDVGLKDRSHINPEFFYILTSEDSWKLLDFGDPTEIPDFISKNTSLLDKKYDLLSDNVESIIIYVLVSLSPDLEDQKDLEPKYNVIDAMFALKTFLFPSKFWTLDTIDYYGHLTGIVDDDLCDLIILKLSKNLGDIEGNLNFELANSLSDAILFNEYDKYITSPLFSYRHIFFQKKGGGLFRAMVPEERNRNKDKNLSIDFKCQINVVLKDTSNSEDSKSLINVSSDWDTINFNNSDQISNFISKKISLLDKKYNLLSDNVESIIMCAMLPTNPAFKTKADVKKYTRL